MNATMQESQTFTTVKVFLKLRLMLPMLRKKMFVATLKKTLLI